MKIAMESMCFWLMRREFIGNWVLDAKPENDERLVRRTAADTFEEYGPFYEVESYRNIPQPGFGRVEVFLTRPLTGEKSWL